MTKMRSEVPRLETDAAIEARKPCDGIEEQSGRRLGGVGRGLSAVRERPLSPANDLLDLQVADRGESVTLVRQDGGTSALVVHAAHGEDADDRQNARDQQRGTHTGTPLC
jgi:hypothetical protein